MNTHDGQTRSSCHVHGDTRGTQPCNAYNREKDAVF